MDYIQRELERKFLSMSSVFKAVMVTGARQVGKSTLYGKILSDMQPDIEPNQILTINCDDPEQRAFLEKANLSDLRQQLAGKRIVMADEAQRIAGVGIKLKLIIDNFKDIQLLVTGSSSFLLQDYGRAYRSSW